jgi:hypothetical protein
MIALLCFFLTRGRVQLTNGDRLFLVLLYRWFPSVLKAITIVRPETLVRWHRVGFLIGSLLLNETVFARMPS